MSQMKTLGWTNPNPAVARRENIGFTVAEITTVDTTNGGSWYWNDQMASGTAIDVDSGLIVATNGFTPLEEAINYGAVISGFTNAAPGVLTVDDTGVAGFANGDTITVAGLSDDGAGTTPLNGTFTIASFTATTITLVESTVGFSVYVSGGFVTRVSDADGEVIPIENFARLGIIIGTSVVGAASAVMAASMHGQNSVV